MSNGTFVKVANNWNALTDAEKIALFKATNYEVPTAAELATLGKFKVVSYAESDDQPICQIRAVPKDQLVLPKGLIAIDSFEGIDKATLTHDIKIGGVNIEGRTWSSTNVMTTDGVFKNGRAFNFDGTSYLSYPDNADFNFGTDDFTISFWIKGTASTQANIAYGTILSRYGVNHKLSAAFNGGNPYIELSDAAYHVANKPILDGNWNFVELIRENGIFYLYKNLEEILQVNIATAFDVGTGGTMIGYDMRSSNTYLDAQVDDMHVVNGQAIRQQNIPDDYIATPVNAPMAKILVTSDGQTYYTYDFDNLDWVVIDHTDIAAVKMGGIDIGKLADIDRNSWDKMTTSKTGIGFAYLLSMTSTADTCQVAQMDLQVDMKGSWNKALYGTDYKYGYPKNTLLRVTLMSDGDYKINYHNGKS